MCSNRWMILKPTIQLLCYIPDLVQMYIFHFWLKAVDFICKPRCWLFWNNHSITWTCLQGIVCVCSNIFLKAIVVSSGATYDFSFSTENKSYLNDSANRGDTDNNLKPTILWVFVVPRLEDIVSLIIFNLCEQLINDNKRLNKGGITITPITILS